MTKNRETPNGPLAETMAIIDYLEETQPDPALWPSDPYARARARQIAHHAIYYIDLAARPGLNAAAFGAPEDPAVNKMVGKATPRGIQSLARIAQFDPWVAGSEFTAADIVVANTVPLAQMVCQKLCDIDIMSELPGLADYIGRVNEREASQRVASEK